MLRASVRKAVRMKLSVRSPQTLPTAITSTSTTTAAIDHTSGTATHSRATPTAAPVRLPSTPPQRLSGSSRGASLGPRTAVPTA